MRPWRAICLSTFPLAALPPPSDRAWAGLLDDKGHLKQNRRVPRVPAQASVSQTPDTGENAAKSNRATEMTPCV